MWHEARKSERKVHDLMDAARKRAQRRAVFLAKRRGDPQQSLQVAGTRCRVYRDDGVYQATEDQQALIPWNGKQDVTIDRFDGRALLDFIRDHASRPRHAQEKTAEEEELEEFVNFERYRDLIKHRRRGFNDEAGLQNTMHELEAKASALSAPERSHVSQASTSKGVYSQVGFSYKGDAHDDAHRMNGDTEDDDDDDDDEDDDFSSDDSRDEGIDAIAKEFGVKRYNWLLYMDKKAKEEKKQMENYKGEPGSRKLSRKERRRASRMERDKERETSRAPWRALHHDPYREQRRSPTYDAYPRSRRSRSRSRSYSPHSRRHNHHNGGQKNRSKAPKIEYITEFGGSNSGSFGMERISPPSSPPSQVEGANRSSVGRILEALHVDPASGVTLDEDNKVVKSPASTSSALTKLNKAGALKNQQAEKKETPQERLKRIMSKQLNKQIKKDAVADMAKKREQERQRKEKLAEASKNDRYHHGSRSRSRSRSPPRRHRRSRSRSQSPSPRYRHRSRSRSSSPERGRGRHRH